jgi:hypothetical protein
VAEKVLGSVTIHPNFIYFEGRLQKQVIYAAEKVLGSVTIHPNFIYFEGQLQKQVT